MVTSKKKGGPRGSCWVRPRFGPSLPGSQTSPPWWPCASSRSELLRGSRRRGCLVCCLRRFSLWRTHPKGLWKSIPGTPLKKKKETPGFKRQVPYEKGKHGTSNLSRPWQTNKSTKCHAWIHMRSKSFNRPTCRVMLLYQPFALGCSKVIL